MSAPTYTRVSLLADCAPDVRGMMSAIAIALPVTAASAMQLLVRIVRFLGCMVMRQRAQSLLHSWPVQDCSAMRAPQLLGAGARGSARAHEQPAAREPELLYGRVVLRRRLRRQAPAADVLRDAGAAVVSELRESTGGAIAWPLDEAMPLSADEQARAIVEGAVLGGYEPGAWKTVTREGAVVSSLSLVTDADVTDAVGRAETAASWANRARDLVNRPANDLSPVLLGRLRTAAPRTIPTIACDIVDIAAHVNGRFDGVVGFFVLHHLLDFEATFRALVSVLRPGGRVAFCEPVAWNPLYYLQIALTPGMSFSGEPSITSMRRGVMLPLK